jgi:hypothetical protein
MKFCCLMMSFLIALPVAAQHSYTDKDVVRYAKAIDVRTLDLTLSSQRLDEWLQSGPAHIDKISWWVNGDCDLKEPQKITPLCVKISFARGSKVGLAMIRVGTWRKGISGPPRLEYVMVWGQTLRAGPDKLSDLPWALDNASPPNH